MTTLENLYYGNVISAASLKFILYEVILMRTNQIETKITRIIDGKPVVHTIYSDADNFAEAFMAHTKALLAQVDATPSFGCVEVREKR